MAEMVLGWLQRVMVVLLRGFSVSCDCKRKKKEKYTTIRFLAKKIEKL